MDRVEEKVKKIALSNLGLINILKLFRLFSKLEVDDGVKYIKIFIKIYYNLDYDMPLEFYELIIKQMKADKYLSLVNVLFSGNIYELISYLKYDNEDVTFYEDIITPIQYYSVSKKHINSIVEKLKVLGEIEEDNTLLKGIKDEILWLLRRNPSCMIDEYTMIAYKIYLTIGLNNGVELLSGKYGKIDYEMIYFLFWKIDVNDDINAEKNDMFCKFMFENKRDYNNIIRQVLRGEFNELFLNFDYLYEKFNYFTNRLGNKMSKEKVKALLNDRFVTHSSIEPQMTGDIVMDMVSSYRNKYMYSKVSEDEIYKKNVDIYNKYLKDKYKSSIPYISIDDVDGFKCEVLKLSDPRNLVLGYRSGNCFRINGDASSLFNNFLKSEHMRLVSISTMDNKDYAMMLVMRNGNVLIGQGIEASDWVSSSAKGKKLYDVCRLMLYQMMNYMNDCGDSIVATIIGRTNENVSLYNNQILPFIINPILEDSGNYYNGIYNYQCLLDLREGKNLNDIKLYVPTMRYYDDRDEILRRYNGNYDLNYREIEKRLMALRFARCKKDGSFEFYNKLLNHKEVYISCNKDWFLILFDNGMIDGFICSNDRRAEEEYNSELIKVKNMLSKGLVKKKFMFNKRKSKKEKLYE